MVRYSIEPRTRKYVKGYRLLLFTNMENNYWILLVKEGRMIEKMLLRK